VAGDLRALGLANEAAAAREGVATVDKGCGREDNRKGEEKVLEASAHGLTPGQGFTSRLSTLCAAAS
jgi:hypothetical protein